MKEFKQRPVLGLIAQSVAVMAALFSLILCILLIADFARIQKMDPLNDPQLLHLREKLAGSVTGDEAVVAEIRTFDLYARRAYFSNEAQRRAGGLLLLGGMITCFIALKFFRLWKPALPAVGKVEQVDHWELNSLFRQLMAGTGIFLAVVSLFLAFVVQSDLDEVLKQDVSPASSRPAEEGIPKVTLPAEFADNWPSLRGSGGIGVAHVMEAPIHWNVESGDGVLWTAEVYVHGFNSPIVWGKRLFLTGADDEGQEVFCFDTDTGKELWTKTVKTLATLPETSEDTGYAAPTMATDGQRIFAIFASGELAAFDFDGNSVWQKNLGVPKNPYGMGSSLISDGTHLFVQYDHNDSQKVMALNSTSGEVVWQMPRKHISWSTPALIETANGLQLILNDEEHVTAYDPSSGKQLWSVACLGGEVAPSPAFNGTDIVFVANEYAQASALKLTEGAPEILWQYDEYLPEISSPLATENFCFITTTAGDAVCLDIGTGEVKWEQEFDEGFNSSPVFAGGRIYAIDIAGVVHIFEAADEYKEIATIEMGEPIYATPAFVDGRIYIRGDENLYCIEDE